MALRTAKFQIFLLMAMVIGTGCSAISDFSDYRFDGEGPDGGGAGSGDGESGTGGSGGESGSGGGSAGTGGKEGADGGPDAGRDDAGEPVDAGDGGPQEDAGDDAGNDGGTDGGTAAICGNDEIEDSEDCDTDLGGLECNDLDEQYYSGAGTLQCTDCQYDTSGCEYCGDGVVNGPSSAEDCDTDLGGLECNDLDEQYYSGYGTLQCTDCKYDTSGCEYCGDGVVTAGVETCTNCLEDFGCTVGEVCAAGREACEPRTYANAYDEIDVTFLYWNNLTNTIWHGPSGQGLTGSYNTDGFWTHPDDAGGAISPTGSGRFCRMVHLPARGVVVFQNSGLCHLEEPTAAKLSAALIDESGALSDIQAVTFPDAFAAACDLQSSSPDGFLCWDGSNVRHYAVSVAGNAIDFSLRMLVPMVAKSGMSSGNNWGGTFAFDGTHYLFSSVNNSGTDYHVYDAAGQYIEEITAAPIGIDNGQFSALYYDWGVKRYAYHDGFGSRRGGRIYEYTYDDITSSDSQGYGRPLADTAPAVLPGPIFDRTIASWPDAGILIRPVRDIRLENFLFNNQEEDDTIKLVEHETGMLLESIALTPTSPNQVIVAGWELSAGVEYRLISEHRSNGQYTSFTDFPVSNSHIEVLSTVNQIGGVHLSHWFTFSHLVTTPR